MTYRKALVTGGAGFIGSHLAYALLKRGVEVVILDNLSMGKRENIPEGSRFVQGDILDINLLRKIVDGTDIVFHQAARVSIRSSMDHFYEDALTNIMGTVNVLRACIDTQVKKFIYASSMAVYADSPTSAPLDENYLTEPISPYGIAKLTSEKYCLRITAENGIDGVVLRYFNTFGPGQTYTPYVGVITIFIQRLLSGQPPVIFGDGEQRRDFTYVGDIVEANLKAMDSDIRGEIFNIGSGIATSVNEVARLLCERINPDAAPQYAALKPGELRNSVASCAKAEKMLGYHPQSNLNDCIDEVIDWIRNTTNFSDMNHSHEK